LLAGSAKILVQTGHPGFFLIALVLDLVDFLNKFVGRVFKQLPTGAPAGLWCLGRLGAVSQLIRFIQVSGGQRVFYGTEAVYVMSQSHGGWPDRCARRPSVCARPNGRVNRRIQF